MNAQKTGLQSFIAEEVSKVKGVYLPVHAGIMERALVRKVNCKKLHPNPDDEFCYPEIGPNESIVSQYERDFHIIREDPSSVRFMKSNATEPLEVQKIQPDGYMILNGHHRWIAAVRAGISRLPVRIVNLTQERDIRVMLEHSKHDRRVVMDLDEVVFRSGRDGRTEKPLKSPLSRVYREQPRIGIPALFAFLTEKGYDIWLYSSGYESVDYVKELLRLYRVSVTGIVTGTARKTANEADSMKNMEKMISGKYIQTVHADNDSIVCIEKQTKEFREYRLKGTGTWSAEVMDAVRIMEKENAEKERPSGAKS